MKLPAIRGVIRRRILVNYRVDPEIVQRQLPEPFRPKVIGGQAMAGICLIRLEQLQPERLATPFGLSSENAAHRIAVCWRDAGGQEREGVYIPRRDTNSCFAQLGGGRLFPGLFQRSHFQVRDAEERIEFSMRSADEQVVIYLRARAAESLPPTTRFSSLEAASDFFRAGADGYSDALEAGSLEGMRLVTEDWSVQPLAVETLYSSYFGDEERFPRGSIQLDCALLMRDISHQWVPIPGIGAGRPVALTGS
jgi:hypothetical protein